MVLQVTWSAASKNCLPFRELTCNACDPKNFCKHFGMIRSISTFNQTSLQNEKSCILKDWIVVVYEKKWYSGEITAIKNNMLITKFVKRNKKV